jgi:hypothetical protein
MVISQCERCLNKGAIEEQKRNNIRRYRCCGGIYGRREGSGAGITPTKAKASFKVVE